MDRNHKNSKFSLSLNLYLNLGLLIIFASAAIFLINQINKQERSQALIEAEAKAKLILDRNLATHTYFSHSLKPKVFDLTEPVRSENYFEPAWMSSTYAVREIDKNFKSLSSDDYYYKECAVNARSPENEADAFEKAFIEELNTNPELKFRSLIRNLDGSYYYITLRRGEVMEEACLRCHSIPSKAPKGLLEKYGSERSFNRNVNDVVSAISIRVPLSESYKRAEQFSKHLSTILVIVIVVMMAVQYVIHKFFVITPLNIIRDKALRISEDEKYLGEVISMPVTREFGELASGFNTMSKKLRFNLDHLEETVEKRTAELEKSNKKLTAALAEIKTLRGILPICSYCKNIRNDEGYYEQIEAYIHKHSGVDFSHTICPKCMKEHYPEVYDSIIDKKEEPFNPTC